MAVDVRGLAQLGPLCGKGFTQLLASLLATLPDLRLYSVNRIRVYREYDYGRRYGIASGAKCLYCA